VSTGKLSWHYHEKLRNT